jgi:hypothetical protein
MPIRTDEQRAPEAIAPLIPKLTLLVTQQPSTEDLEAALLASKAMTRAIHEWLASRYSAQAATRIATETPEERAELDRIEHAHVHPAFAPVLEGLMRRGA